ncbi:hypothetical protein JM18_002220 [Phytophthora kernoviae]|uniref:Tubulin-specific chaperone D C-terminal domain-containing protein n=2 Tax=Phytophthora kernoviae TaxID=325452 RepID=A0A8T0M4S0_9STRA|nr:hypothetical protein G195_004303 [Phytophthora kernoviae 00238/432]KAG2527318.1 hypothetical protein JM16_003514 [Phytophthora kernoviae]KAG2530337.1 hypothetical protein JM18_002220 [Phytophthora kernoviae]
MSSEDATDAALDAESSGEKRFFEEREQVRGLLKQLVSTRFPTPLSDVDREFLAAHDTVTQILDKYLEQSHLLDPYLHEMLDPIVAEIKRVMTERRNALEAAATDEAMAFPCQVYRDPRLHKLFQIVYHLCKVRGYKTVVKLLPHEVSDFEPTLQLLQSQDRTDHSAWETRYVLLLWLSMLCLVPFDLHTIDSSTPSAADSASGTISIVSNIVTLCKDYLSDPGATQVAAAVCLSRLLSRPDMEKHDLTQFLNWANRELITASEGKDMRVLQFKVTGIMLCLAHIAKNAPREQHIEASRIYFATVMRLVAHLTEDNARSDRPSSSTLHRKLSVKLVQRLGLLYLPPKVRSWRYSRGLRSLELNMQALGLNTGRSDDFSVSSRRQDGNSAVHDIHGSDDEETFEVVDELEQIVEVLLCGLRDKDTVVRWSAAKGIGRITGRLPYEFADDIVQSVLELFVATEDDGAWHGASLALAELARRGVLLPQRLPDAVDCVANALRYDIRKGTYSIGYHVRDAACYACWSFARAYEPSLLLPWLKQTLAPAMLVNCVFDRELNCRRAASAAFQENVGRQGVANFPNGIDLLTKADYFSVANLRHAYLNVSVFIAKYPEYRYPLSEHLFSSKIVHWDIQIRNLAAAALGKIAALDPTIAELFMALVQVPVFIDGELQKEVKMLPIEIDKRRLFRGRGGEMIRGAVCNVIEVISNARLSLGFAHVKKYLAMLEECFVNPNESVRDAAIDAFGAFTAQVDERGDVGSWVRKEAMVGLEKLLLGESTHAHNQNFRLIGAATQTDYGRGIIVDVNWSMAHDTFPLVVKMMDIPEFMEEVAAGLVVSVGGLTESVVKASKSSLFEWVRAHVQSKDFGLLSRFSFFLVTLLTRHHHDDRVTIPLMKTMASLLESNLLRFLFEERQADDGSVMAATDFGERLYEALRDEIQKCISIPKLDAAISVLIGLLPSDSEIEAKSLRALVLFLGHRFPKVRKLTAERLYTRLLLHEEVINEEKYDQVVEILSDTAWDASITQVRTARNELLELLDMELPSKKLSTGQEARTPDTTTPTQEDTSYKTLIKEMGY